MARKFSRRNSLIKALAATLVLLLFALGSASDSDTAAAGGPSFKLAPKSGALGTTVQLTSTEWNPGDSIAIYAAFSPSLTEKPSDDAFVGPLASTTTDSSGAWSVPVQMANTGPLLITGEPGFVFFRVRSPAHVSNHTRSIVHFALISEDRRPAGAGEIRLSISLAPGVPQDSRLLQWAWRPSTARGFRIHSAPPATSLPFATTIAFLPDGDWEVTALASGGLVPVGEGPVRAVDVAFCNSYPCPEDPNGSYVVRTVTIRNGNVADVSLVLGARDLANTLAAAGQGHQGQSSTTLTFALVALSLCGAALLAVGLLARRVRPSS